jgi:hypothetical protein
VLPIARLSGQPQPITGGNMREAAHAEPLKTKAIARRSRLY